MTSVESIASGWRELAAKSGRAALDSPDWQLPLAGHYLNRYETRVLTWHDGGELVAICPLSLVADRPPIRRLRQLSLWGTIGPRMRGLVDVVAADHAREAVLDSLCRWLRDNDEWDLFRIVRPQVGSETPGRLKRESATAGWAYRPFANIRSTTYQLDLPSSPEGWQKHLGSKARKVMRWELRKFAEFRGGRLDVAIPLAEVPAALDAAERMLSERWGESEVYFAHDPVFRPFVHEAVSGMVEHDSAWITVARDETGIQGVLVTLAQGGWAMALTIAMSTDPDYRPFSLGKHLFDAGLGEAVRRGCHSYDFLWVGGYKESFWHATPRFLESAMVGRGVVGRLAASVLARRA